MFDLTGFQRDLLVAIRNYDGDKPHGLLFKDQMSDLRGVEINHGRLYPNLDELVERGLVEKGEYDRRTNTYHVTDDGHAALAEWFEWAESEA